MTTLILMAKDGRFTAKSWLLHRFESPNINSSRWESNEILSRFIGDEDLDANESVFAITFADTSRDLLNVMIDGIAPSRPTGNQ